MSIPEKPTSVDIRARLPFRLNYEAIAFVAAAIDICLIVGSSLVAGFVYHQIAFGAFYAPSEYLGVGLVYAVIFALVVTAGGKYKPSELVSLGRQLPFLVIVSISIFAFLAAVIFFLKIGELLSRGSMIVFAGFSLFSLVTSRIIWRNELRIALDHGLFQIRRALVVCSKTYAIEPLQGQIARYGLSISHVVRFCDEGSATRLIGDALDGAQSFDIDEVLVIGHGTNLATLKPVLMELRALPLPAKLILDDFAADIVSKPVRQMGDKAAIQVQRRPLTIFERALKRSFDIAFAATALIMLSPMLILVSIAIKLDTRGPIFFTQRRKGYGDNAFRILKFRTMTVMEDGEEIRQASRGDQRVTRVGALLRSTSIDELPQFLNVLRGDMSVVGPRPHAVAHDNQYDKLIAKYAYRRHVRPGLTGWAQINGHRGETPTVLSMEERVNHDLWYIHNWSFWLDIQIVLRTFPEMLSSKTGY